MEAREAGAREEMFHFQRERAYVRWVKWYQGKAQYYRMVEEPVNRAFRDVAISQKKVLEMEEKA